MPFLQNHNELINFIYVIHDLCKVIEQNNLFGIWGNRHFFQLTSRKFLTIDYKNFPSISKARMKNYVVFYSIIQWMNDERARLVLIAAICQ